METIDLTPTWSEHLNTCLLLLDNLKGDKRKPVIKELRNMATIADKYVELMKQKPVTIGIHKLVFITK